MLAKAAAVLSERHPTPPAPGKIVVPIVYCQVFLVTRHKRYSVQSTSIRRQLKLAKPSRNGLAGLTFCALVAVGRYALSESLTDSGDAVSFGPFQLIPSKRQLLKDGKLIRLQGRALDVLITLARHANKTVSQRELTDSVWPDTFVEESNLRVHISAVRRALGDGKAGPQYIANIAGRGYRLVTPPILAAKDQTPDIPALLDHGLPLSHTNMVGRDDVVESIMQQLSQRRFVTIVGSGGIGKSRVAIAIAAGLTPDYRDGIRFVDLAPLSDPLLVPSMIAAALGLAIRSDDPLPALITYLRDKELLLVFDNCDQVIETMAALTEQILRNDRSVHVLATSREAMRADGERVIRLAPLGVPEETADLTAAQAMNFPAIQLFVQRAIESRDSFELTDDEAPIVANICRRLDGIALAIELAAGRVDTFGVSQLDSLLDNRFKLLTRGRRTALPRHRTLSATVDWSYNALSETERAVLRRVSIFSGGFTLDAAEVVAWDEIVDRADIDDTIANLVAKSLITADVGGAFGLYRLLETTRAYGYIKLQDAKELNIAARRHAQFFLEDFERKKGASDTRQSSDVRTSQAELENARNALEWAFSAAGDMAISISLAAAICPTFLERSLFTESLNWTDKALARCVSPASLQELELLTARAVALPFTTRAAETYDTLLRALDLAKALKSKLIQIRLLEELYIFHIRVAQYPAALDISRQAEAVLAELDGSELVHSTDWMLATSHHYIGSHALAASYAESALKHIPSLRRSNNLHFGLEPRLHAQCILARTLWITGYPERAIVVSHNAIEDAQAIANPVMLCSVLTWVSPIFLWTGDITFAESCIGRLSSQAKSYSLAPYQAMAIGLEGNLMVWRGQVASGIVLLNASLSAMHAIQQEILMTIVTYALADAYAKDGRISDGQSMIGEALKRIERHGEGVYLPEVLRIQGVLFAAEAQLSAAEECFLRSLDFAAQRSALSWELKTAMRLAKLWEVQDRKKEARNLLGAVCAKFKDGRNSVDIESALRFRDSMA
jgi:predicted ATPase/DNA-binding winged helix-turn-helix (wHTH) protein